MEFALVMRELWGQKRLLALGVVVSMICAILSVYQVKTVLPPKLTQRALQYSSASIQTFVDVPHSFVGDLTAPLAPVIDRATVFANLMASPGALDLIGQNSGIPGDQLWAAGPVDPTQQRVIVEPTVSKRSFEVAGEALPYRIEFLADPNLPLISIYTQAPTTPQAIALANGSVQALKQYVHDLQVQQHIQPAAWVTIRTIGPASGALVNGGINKKLAGLVFFAIFGAWCVLVLVCSRFRANWRKSGRALNLDATANGRNGRATRRWAVEPPVEEQLVGSSKRQAVPLRLRGRFTRASNGDG
jgi:hypothetical protein